MYAKLAKITLSNLRVKRRDLQPNSAFPLISSSSTTNPWRIKQKFNQTPFFGFMGWTCAKSHSLANQFKAQGDKRSDPQSEYHFYCISSSSATNPMEIITNVMSDPTFMFYRSGPVQKSKKSHRVLANLFRRRTKRPTIY